MPLNDPDRGEDDDDARRARSGPSASHPPKASTDRKESRSSGLVMAAAGLEMGGAIAVMTWLGWWLDQKWGISPYLTLTGLGMGLIGGTYNVWRAGKKYFGDGK